MHDVAAENNKVSVKEDAIRRIEAALEERKRQRRKAVAKPESFPDERRGPATGRREKDERLTGVATPTNPAS